MMKFLFILFSLFICPSAFAQTKVVIGVLESPPYFEEKRPDGQGMVCELLTAAFQKAGYSVTFEFYPLARLFDTLIDGKVTCTVLGNLSPEEKTQVIESKSIFLSENVLFYKKSRFPAGINFNDLSELRGYIIGIKNGSIPTIKMLTDKGLTIDLANTSEQLFVKLNLGRTDFAVSTDIGGLEIIKLSNLSLDDFGYTKFISASKRVLIFSSKNPNKKLITDFDTAYRTIMKNGTYNQILEKYYGIGKIPESVLSLINEW